MKLIDRLWLALFFVALYEPDATNQVIVLRIVILVFMWQFFSWVNDQIPR